MADEFGPAIAALERKLAEQHSAVLDTKRSINLLLRMAGQSPQYAEDNDPSSSSVRPDQFYGRGLTTCAAEYLAMRKQACQPVEILRALEMGGFDFDILPWGKKDRLREFANALAKNTGSAGKFHKLKNGSLGLRTWYDEDFLKKVKKGEEGATKSKKPSANKKKVGKKIGKAQAPPTKTPPTKTTSKPAAQKDGPKKPELVKTPTSSAKEKSRPVADQTTQKAAAS